MVMIVRGNNTFQKMIKKDVKWFRKSGLFIIGSN